MTLSGEHLGKRFEARRGRRDQPTHTVAVDDVSFALPAGTTLGVVGESGSGKSTLARLALGLLAPSQGEVRFEGDPLTGFDRARRRAFRRAVAPVFQDPRSALNWRHSIETITTEPLVNVRDGNRRSRRERAARLLEQVHLPRRVLDQRPAELSGGMLQRVAIARALALEPRYLICDEPLSALDVSVQAGVVNLLLELQAGRGLAIMFISHDLAVVRHISDRVLVMYRGRVLEQAPAEQLYRTPRHPYTRHLLGQPDSGWDPAHPVAELPAESPVREEVS
jgi:peptide/nickel transport system ATP-binding protein